MRLGSERALAMSSNCRVVKRNPAPLRVVTVQWISNSSRAVKRTERTEKTERLLRRTEPFGAWSARSVLSVLSVFSVLSKRPRTHLIGPVIHPRLLLRRPEAELLGPARGLQPPTAEGEKAAGPGRHHAESAEVGEPPERGPRPLVHDAARGDRADARHAQQRFVVRRVTSTGNRSGCASAHADLGSTESGRLPPGSNTTSSAVKP